MRLQRNDEILLLERGRSFYNIEVRTLSFVQYSVEILLSRLETVGCWKTTFQHF